MLTPSTLAATPISPDTTNTAKAASVEAAARAAANAQSQAADANEARVADVAAAAVAARQAATEVPDPMASLSTVAVAGALNSLPAALNMMRSIVMASASGTLTEADRQTLHSEYAQLSAQVVSAVGSVGAGEQAQTSTAHDNPGEDDANASRDNRNARSVAQPQQAAQPGAAGQPQPPAADGQAPTPPVPADVRTPALQVGADSYAPVPNRRATRSAPPATSSAALETRTPERRTRVAQAEQITQFVHAAQAEPVAPLVAVA